MQISEHFTLAQFEFSQTAIRHGIDNSVPPELIPNIQALCDDVLEPLWENVGPLVISSGYRCKRLNKLIGGSARSQHTKGQAADIVAPGVWPRDVALMALYNTFDQLILEFNRWVHISYSASNNRGQVLTSRKSRDGDTKYLIEYLIGLRDL